MFYFLTADAKQDFFVANSSWKTSFVCSQLETMLQAESSETGNVPDPVSALFDFVTERSLSSKDAILKSLKVFFFLFVHDGSVAHFE